MCLPMKEYITGNRCERKNMDSKCKTFMPCSKNFKSICKIIKKMTANKDYLRDHRFGGSILYNYMYVQF